MVAVAAGGSGGNGSLVLSPLVPLSSLLLGLRLRSLSYSSFLSVSLFFSFHLLCSSLLFIMRLSFFIAAVIVNRCNDIVIKLLLLICLLLDDGEDC